MLRTDNGVVVIAWAIMTMERFRAKHGRDPAMGAAGVATWDARECGRLMESEPCWDCGAKRENQADYFCNACRDARTAEYMAEVDAERVSPLDDPEHAARIAREGAAASREIAERVRRHKEALES